VLCYQEVFGVGCVVPAKASFEALPGSILLVKLAHQHGFFLARLVLKIVGLKNAIDGMHQGPWLVAQGIHLVILTHAAEIVDKKST
jgi:hypothetical protein